jgi:hypothetical protein
MQDFDLVDENYYDKELKYQGEIDKLNRAERLEEKIKVTQVDKFAVIQFPRSFNVPISGNIILYRPSDASLDKKFKIDINNDFQHVIDISKLLKGLWELKIDWVAGDSLYYNSEELYIN